VNDPDVPVLSPVSAARLRTFETYLTAGVDEFDLAGHLRAWRDHPPGYPVLFLRYEHLADRWDDVRRFLGIPDGAAPFEVRPRASSWRSLPRHQAAMLDRMYGELAAHVAALPPVEVI
jgi:hypothetical protein